MEINIQAFLYETDILTSWWLGLTFLHVRFPIKDDKSEKEADGKESKPEQTGSNQNKPEEKEQTESGATDKKQEQPEVFSLLLIFQA